jgi:predicted naringenin-chalcone synthase
MGCYAALPAIRMAEGFVAAEKQRVDIVHTEMCGLHMDSHDNSPEQLVVQSLFADGHVKYSVLPAGSAGVGFKVLKICEQIIPETQADMSWITASWGMKMTLSREVPAKISSNIRGFIEKIIEGSGYKLNEILKEAIFAVHPGGPKIIDLVREVLEITDEQVGHSRAVLLNRGNMSSATLPHVWQKILEQNPSSGKIILSLAFGPGLTLFGALFEVV